nr:hypothetical protein [Ardenticatena sp.]
MRRHTRAIDPHNARRIAERLLQQLGPVPTILEVLAAQRRVKRLPVQPIQTKQGRLVG